MLYHGRCVAGGYGEEQEDPAGQESGLRPQGCRGEWAKFYDIPGMICMMCTIYDLYGLYNLRGLYDLCDLCEFDLFDPFDLRNLYDFIICVICMFLLINLGLGLGGNEAVLYLLL